MTKNYTVLEANDQEVWTAAETPMSCHNSRMNKTSSLERFATMVTNWAELWFPDLYIFAVLAAIFVAIGALISGVSAHSIATSFGEGY